MKVFLDARRSYGGIERYTRGVLAALQASLPADRLVAFGPARALDEAPVPQVRSRGRAVLGHAKRVALDLVALPRAARASGAGVYHALGPHVPPGLALASIATCFDVCVLDHPATRPSGLMERYERKALVSGLARASHVVAVSDAVASRLRERGLVAPERVSVVSPPLSRFPAPRALTAPQTSGRFFLFVGTLEPRKDLMTLLAAHTRAFESCRVPLVIAGAYGWRQAEVLERIRRAGDRVLWAGPVDDAQLAWLYGHAAALVQTSLDEGFSYPVAEALSFGLPVVASDIAVHREVAGSAAHYAPVGDVDAVSERMRQALEPSAAQRAAFLAECRRRIAALTERSSVSRLVALQTRVANRAPAG